MVIGVSSFQVAPAPLAGLEQVEGVRHHDRFCVKFADGTHNVYDHESLAQLHFFATIQKTPFAEGKDGEIVLPAIDRKVFEMVYAFQVEKRSIYQLLTSDLMQKNPLLVEEFIAALNFLHPLEVNSQGTDAMARRSDELLWQLAPTLDYDAAVIILKEYGTQDATQPLPFVVERANQIMVQAAFFKTADEARLHFKAVTHAKMQKELAHEHYMSMQATFLHCGAASGMQHIGPILAEQQQRITKFEKVMQELSNRVDIDKLTVVQAHILALKAEDPNPTIAKFAKMAQKQLEEYRRKVTAAMRANGADVTRHDLLEHFIGPKNYLLEHYGLFVPEVPNTPNFPFALRKRPHDTAFDYTLRHNSIYDLEEELRSDVLHYYPLPPRVIEKRECTKPQSEEVIKVRAKIMPLLQTWATRSVAERREVKRELLKQIKFEQIHPNDMRIRSGNINLAAERILLEFRWYNGALSLNLWDLKTYYGEQNAVKALPTMDQFNQFRLADPWASAEG